VLLLVEDRAELETGISLPVAGFGWLVAGVVAATAVMVCAIVAASVVGEFATGVEVVGTGVGAAVDCGPVLFAVLVGVTDEFTVGVMVGAGLLAGAGVGAGAVKLVTVGAGAATGIAVGAGVVSVMVATGVNVAGAVTGVAVVLDVSGVVAGVADGAVVTAGVSVLAADASVVVRGEAVVATVVVVEEVGSWPFVNEFAPHDVGRVVIASTDGMFCVLCNCEAWSMAWIMIVAMSEPADTVEESLVLEVEVEGVVVVAVVAAVLVVLESRATCAGVFPAGRVCAAVIVAIAEAVVPAVVKLVTVTGIAFAGGVGGVVVFAGVFCAVEFFPRGVKESGP